MNELLAKKLFVFAGAIGFKEIAILIAQLFPIAVSEESEKEAARCRFSYYLRRLVP
jgi:hypothetical protein